VFPGTLTLPVHRVIVKNLVTVLHQFVQRSGGAPGPLVVVSLHRLEIMRFCIDLVGIILCHVPRQATPPKEECPTVLRARAELEVNPQVLLQMDRIQRFGQFLLTGGYPTRAAIPDDESIPVGGHGSEVRPEADISRFDIHPDTEALKYAATGVHLVRVVPQKRQVRRVAPRSHSRSDRIDQTGRPSVRQLVKVGSPRSLKTGLSVLIGRPTAQPIGND
jgi:hypothetical protein